MSELSTTLAYKQTLSFIKLCSLKAFTSIIVCETKIVWSFDDVICGFAETCLTNFAQGEGGTSELDYDLHFIVMVSINQSCTTTTKAKELVVYKFIITFSDIWVLWALQKNMVWFIETCSS